MNKEQKCISLPLAQELQKVAKENGFELLESEKYWLVVKDNSDTPAEIVNYCGKNRSGKYSDGIKWSEKYYRAYDTSELGEMLPDNVESYHRYKKWTCGEHRINHWENAESEAEARGKMLIYLISNKLI